MSWGWSGIANYGSASGEWSLASPAVVGGGIYNPVAGTCQNPCIVCPGATGSEILPSSFSIPAGTSESFQFFVIENNGSTENYSESATWEGSSSVLSVQPQLATGLEAGSAGISANMSAGVPEYSASFCAGTACPTGGQGASISGTVTPVVSGVSPSMAPAGMSQAIVISGAGFGSSPVVTVGGGASAVVNSSSSTTINATLTIPGTASGGNQNLAVTADGIMSSSILFFIQIPTSLTVVSAVLAGGSGCPGSKNYGVQATDTYQVWDQHNPALAIQVAGMNPTESGTYFSGGTFSGTVGAPTASNGTFIDTPVGVCSPVPINPTTLTATQNIYINGFQVRAQTYTETVPAGTAGFGHGQLKNNLGDINVQR